jgi:sortase B
MLVGASDDYIFEPTDTRNDIKSLLDYTQENALFLNEDVLTRARETENLQILALTTCSSEFTDARTIVLTVMAPHTAG